MGIFPTWQHLLNCRKKLLLLYIVYDVAKRFSVPRLDPLSEIHEGQSNVIQVSIPRVSDEVSEGRIVKPHRFQAKRSWTKVEGNRVSINEDWVMIEGCMVEVKDGGFIVKEFPLGIG